MEALIYYRMNTVRRTSICCRKPSHRIPWQLSGTSQGVGKNTRHWYLEQSILWSTSKYGTLSFRTKLRLPQLLAWRRGFVCSEENWSSFKTPAWNSITYKSHVIKAERVFCFPAFISLWQSPTWNPVVKFQWNKEVSGGKMPCFLSRQCSSCCTRNVPLLKLTPVNLILLILRQRKNLSLSLPSAWTIFFTWHPKD